MGVKEILFNRVPLNHMAI